MQQVLDDRINYEGTDKEEKKILALIVELGECANEWRGFKFWSKDQTPRTGIPGFYNSPLLEEYVDCLHFILSIGNELHHYDDKTNIDFEKEDRDITWHFHSLINVYSDLWNYGEIDEPYGQIIKRFLDLGELLGFTYQEIEQAYLNKNEVNHARQENGY